MGRTAGTKLVLVALVAAMLLVASNAAITCGQVSSAVGPCAAYAKGSTATPSGACCNGVKRLAGLAQSTVDKRKACDCLKSAIRGFDGAKAATIPSKCRVNVPYKISMMTDCSKIQ